MKNIGAMLKERAGVSPQLEAYVEPSANVGSAFFRNFAPKVPEMSSAFVKVGRTAEKWTPVLRHSMRAESVNPNTAYLLAQ